MHPSIRPHPFIERLDEAFIATGKLEQGVGDNRATPFPLVPEADAVDVTVSKPKGSVVWVIGRLALDLFHGKVAHHHNSAGAVDRVENRPLVSFQEILGKELFAQPHLQLAVQALDDHPVLSSTEGAHHEAHKGHETQGHGKPIEHSKSTPARKI